MFKRSYLYGRVSSPKQDTYSQRPTLLKWAEANEPLAQYIEDVGTGKNMARPGIQTIMAGIQSGMTKKVIVVSVNRVGRNTGQVHDFLELCLKHDVQLLSLRENLDISTPMGRMFVKLLAVVAELENEQRSQATLAGLDARYPRDPVTGRRNIPRHVGKGYSLKVTATLAAGILASRAVGKSYRAIAAECGLSDKTVREICLNPRPEYITRKQHAERQRKAKKG